MKSLLISGMSFVLTTFVIGNAYIQKKQFYPSVVYITKSNSSMAVIYLQALVFVVLMGKLLRALFFGQLRAAEMEHLIERSWYAVTETCLAFTVFRDDFSPRFVALFTLLLFLKCFHWLAEDRIDFMERSPTISWLFHMRALALMLVLSILDIMFVRHAYYSTLLKGPSVQLVFGFEYEILLTVVIMIAIKYILHTIDLQSENPWDNKAMYLLYSELVIGFIRVVLYILFFVVMIKVHTFPLFAIRPMYLTLRAFQKAAQDVILSRRAIRNMNTLYPDATPEELSAGDSVCIICREDMTTACKKLPCNHIFHTSCLRTWFQRQQTCPTCRLEVLRMPRGAAAQRGQAQQDRQQGQQDQAPNQAQAANNPMNNMPGMFGGFPFQWPPNAGAQGMPPPFMWPGNQQPVPGQQQQQQQQQPASQQAAETPSTPTSSSAQQTQAQAASSSSSPTEPTSVPSTPSSPPFSGAIPGMPFGGMPPFMPPMMPPFLGPMGFPPPPVPMEGLSDDELKMMEGVERTNVEARIHWLRDIQTLLDGAMVLIGQYNTVASQLGVPGISSSAAPPFNAQASTTNATSSSSPSSSPSSTPSQPAQPYTWSYEQGARPKYSSPATKTQMSGSGQKTHPNSSENSKEDAQLNGSAASPKPEDIKSEPIVSKENEKEDEGLQEVRKRRLEHFSQPSDDGVGDGASADDKKSS